MLLSLTFCSRKRENRSFSLCAVGDLRPGGAQIHPADNYCQHQQQAPPLSAAPTVSMPKYLALREKLLQSQSQSQSIPQPQPSHATTNTNTTTRKNEFGLSSDSILKLAELKSRLYAHSSEFPDFEIIYQGARHFAMTGDNSVLDEKLTFFRSIDAIRSGQSNNMVV